MFSLESSEITEGGIQRVVPPAAHPPDVTQEPQQPMWGGRVGGPGASGILLAPAVSGTALSHQLES